MPLKSYLIRGIWRLLLVALLSYGYSGRAAEEDDVSAVTNQPALKVDVRANVEGAFMPYRYAFVTAGSDKYTFLVPDRYRVDPSDPASVKLISPDCSCFIVIGVRGAGVLPRGHMTPESLRAYVSDHYFDVTIKGDEVVSAGGNSAPALDFNWKAVAGITRSTRTAFIPTANGTLEFTLTTSPEQFPEGLNQLNLVMLTFRTSSNGRFNYVIGSNQP